MNLLVIGGGGREHAIVKKCKESPKVTGLYCAPGNGGISKDARCVDMGVMDFPKITAFCKEREIDLVVVAPDDPLVAGLVDVLEENGIRAFGPRKNAAVIEGSKVFSKELMKKYRIPTAGYEVFDDPGQALAYIKRQGSYPAVVKADGLALGKGVVIAQDYREAEEAIRSIMEDKIFGESGSHVVIEEFLTGPEVSVLAFVDGKSVKPMVSAKDHKRVFAGDLGPNTGGMGTVSPNPHYTPELEQRCMDEIFLPTVEALQKEGRPFKGCLFFGLMMTEDGPKVIEYNARFGDPETQVVLPRLKTDLVDIMEAVIDGRLDTLDIAWDERAAACVVLASGGYPKSYQKGFVIEGLDKQGCVDGAIVYHAGTKERNGRFFTNGGRVLGITALGASLDEALDNAYAAVEQVTFDGAHYRVDIGRTK